MSTDAEKLAQIAALCDECDSFSDAFTGETFSIRKVRAILAESGPAVPPHTIDRDALIFAIADEVDSGLSRTGVARFADRILALVQPVEGVTLTSEDCERVLSWYRSAEVHWDATEKADRALAARLEAVSS